MGTGLWGMRDNVHGACSANWCRKLTVGRGRGGAAQPNRVYGGGRAAWGSSLSGSVSL